jgi:hypothetical protein
LKNWADKIVLRSPDFKIGPDKSAPYLSRWYVIPRNPLFNIYLHAIHKSDQDDALHDHPWWNVSIILENAYDEIIGHVDGRHRVVREEGQIIFRLGKTAHALILNRPFNQDEEYVLSLFLTGPRFRVWGFWCPQGWRDHITYNGKDKGGRGGEGMGCGE